jgi:hypothetical protein
MMSNPHELTGCDPCSAARRIAGEQPRRAWAKRMTRCVLSFLVLWFAAVLTGCGETAEQAKEQRQEKQKVVQEKMKEYMQQKFKSHGAKR